jgi:thioesterase domain-containing protein
MTARDAPRPQSLPIAEATFPCSPAQRRFWIAAQMAPRDPALNVSLRWEIGGAAQPAHVERALLALIARHETLRTRIVEEHGEPAQKVTANALLRFSTIDLTHLPLADREARAEAIAREEARTGFDIATPPLQRFTLLRIEPTRAWLLLTFHHAVFDGGSIDLTHRDFSLALDAALAGAEPAFEPLALQYGDYARWRVALAESGALEEGRAYWRAALRDPPLFDLPADRPRLGGAAHPAQIVARTLETGAASGMEARARALGMTLFSLNAAALAACLAQAVGRDDVVFTTQVSGRDHVDLEDLIGVFVNTVVLRLRATPGTPTPAFLAEVNARVIEALSYADTPFGDVVDIVRPPREPARAPMATINFTLLGKNRERGGPKSARLRRLPSFSPGAQYDLNFFLVHWPEGWRMAIEYDATLFDIARMRALLDAWEASLRAVVSGEGALAGFAPQNGDAEARPTSAPSSAPSSAPANAPPVAHEDVRGKAAAIWREALGAAEIHDESDFFALGGHSLLAVRVAPRIASALGVSVNVMDLFRAPRFADFVGLLEHAAREDWRVTPIPPARGAPPVFALHNSFAYRGLAERLAGRYDLIGLQLFDPHAPTPLAGERIEDVAARYVALMRARQPVGPYRLVGLCVAGVIAFEAARQLEQAGERVDWLALLDCVAPGALAALPARKRLAVAWSYRLHVLRRHYRDWRAGKSLAEVLAHYRALRPLAGERESDDRPWFQAPLERARAVYRPGRVVAPTLVVYSDEFDAPFAREGLGWRRHLGPATRVAHARGWHADILREGVEAIAAAILDAPAR